MLPGVTVFGRELELVEKKGQGRPTCRKISVLGVEPIVVLQPIAVTGSQMSRLVERRRLIHGGGHRKHHVNECEQARQEPARLWANKLRRPKFRARLVQG